MTLEIENRGSVPQEINLFGVGNTALFLEVLDAAGNRVPTVPPPVPPLPEELARYDVTLAPGESRSFEHRLSVFSPPLPPGTYSIRIREPSMAANEPTFVIDPTAP